MVQKIKDIVQKYLNQNNLKWSDITHCNRPKSFFELDESVYRRRTPECELRDYSNMNLVIFANDGISYFTLLFGINFASDDNDILVDIVEVANAPEDYVWSKFEKENYKVNFDLLH